MITPETLTNEMVREASDRFALRGLSWLVTDCFEALGPSDMFWSDNRPTSQSMLAARQRICDALNSAPRKP